MEKCIKCSEDIVRYPTARRALVAFNPLPEPAGRYHVIDGIAHLILNGPIDGLNRFNEHRLTCTATLMLRRMAFDNQASRTGRYPTTKPHEAS